MTLRPNHAFNRTRRLTSSWLTFLLGRHAQMRQWITIWLALIAIHVALFALVWFGVAQLVVVVVASIYLPLWALGKLGVPVISSSESFFPPPTFIGWVAIVLSWSIFYCGVAFVVGLLIAARKRAV